MTPLQGAYLAKLKATSVANLEYFKLNFPRLYSMLAAEPPQTEVDLSDQCDITLKRPGSAPEPVAASIVEMEDRLRSFARVAERPQLIAFQSLRRVQDEDEVGHGSAQFFHYSKLDADYPNRIRKHFVKHYPDQKGLLRDPSFGGRNLPIVMVFGVGLGGHLSRLVLDYDIRHIMIVEPDIEQFRLSLFFNDYVEFGRLALEKGTSISFVLESDIDEICMDIVRLVQVSHPPFFIHGTGLFFASRDTEFVNAIKQVLPVKLWHAFFGLGYFDDELISQRHTFVNLQRGVPFLQNRGVVDPDAVAFIIGSGPSLDALKPFLREYGDRAILFSCGTALSSLEHAGIVPDFHIEKERPNLVYEVLTHSVSESFRRRIRFIGANVVHPEVPPLFSWSGLVAKSSDSSIILLWPDKEGPVVLNVQPTVTNTALNLVAALGFRTIYLIGVDFGYADTSKHHSEHTVYLKNIPPVERLQRLFSRTGKSTVRLKGNFGGTVYSTNIYNSARMTMEDDIRSLGDVRVFNPNHGAYIEGAEPIHADEIQIPARLDKAKTIAAIESAFSLVDVDLGATAIRLLDHIDDFIARMREILAMPLGTKRDVLDAMDRVYQYVFDRENIRKPQSFLFRGSIIHTMAHTYQMLSIIEDEGEAAAKATYDFGLVLEMLDDARAELVAMFEDIGVLPRLGKR